MAGKRKVLSITEFAAGAVLEKAQIQSGAQNPANPSPGQVFLNTTAGNIVFYHGGAWVELVNMAEIAGFAPINNPTFTGNARAPAPAANSNDNTIATTAHLNTLLGGIVAANITDLRTAVEGIVNTMVMDGADGDTAIDTISEFLAKIRANADGIASITTHFSASFGDGAATSFVIEHNRGTRDVVAQVRETAAPYDFVEVAQTARDENNLVITVASAPAADALRVKILA